MADAIFGAIDQLGFVVADLDRSLSGRMRALALARGRFFAG